MTAHIDEEEIEEDEDEMPSTQYGKRRRINQLRDWVFFTGLALSFSIFCNAILIVRFML